MKSPLVCSTPTAVSPHSWLTLNPPKFRESAKGSCLYSLGPAAWIYNGYTSSDRFYTCLPPLCLPATLLVRSADSVSFVLVPISPRCSQRNGRDYSAFLVRAPALPACGVCSTCGRRFKRLDTHTSGLALPAAW